MSRKEIHLVPNSNRGGWDLEKNGAKRVSGHFDTKAEATKAGIDMAKKQHAELISHLKNGQIQNPNSYGNDPCPPKDKK